MSESGRVNFLTNNKSGGERGAVSLRSFDLLNSMISDLKRSVNLREPFKNVLADFVR